MNKDDICFMSAYDMLDKIRSQELTSQEITEVVIERIEEINDNVQWNNTKYSIKEAWGKSS